MREGPYLYTEFWNIATITLCYNGLWSVLYKNHQNMPTVASFQNSLIVIYS